jgi:hypothetical protein
VQACPDGHIERVWYNSCRHRFCPQCTQLQIAQWLEKQKARLPACDHYHVIFTLPSELHALWLANVSVFAHLLFRAAWETLSDLLGDPKYLGATPGMIAALHTWGQTLVLHPHLHCLVTGGGWDGAQWHAVRNGYLLPARVVMPVFRGKLLAALGKAVDAGQLTLPLGVTLPQQRMLLNRLGRQPWHVQIMTRYAYGQGVATYLACYLRGGPLKSARVVAWDAQTVTLRYADNQEPDAHGRGTRKPLTLPAEEFLSRLFTHVPPPHLQVVRSFGLFATAARQRLAACRALLGAGEGPAGAPAAPPAAPLPQSDPPVLCRWLRPRTCPQCGRALIVRESFGPDALRSPPEVRRAA